MFIRKVHKKNPGSKTHYTYYRLVESYRGAGDKPRQRVILSLGKLEGLPTEKHKLLADKVEHLLTGQQEIFDQYPDPEVDRLVHQFYREILQKGGYHAPFTPSPKEPAKGGDFVEIDLDSLEHEDVREVGAEWLCKQVLDQSGIKEKLELAGVKGATLDKSLIAWLSRMVRPGSERATATWLQERSGLCELYSQRSSLISRFHLYQASLRLYKYKDMIEAHLADHSRNLFSLQDKILLYDLTNTYFEGGMKRSDRAKHGRSKEKRRDARLISLAMVVDPLGFPKYSRFYDGNVSEPDTLKDLLKELDSRPAPSEGVRPMVVIDAGIATDDNLKMLRGAGYDYLCGQKL